MKNIIYALFLYYGEPQMGIKNFLCLRIGTPEEILNYLLYEGYLLEVYSFGRYLGTKNDQKYLRKIEQLKGLSKVDRTTIEKIDIHMPSCCTCIKCADNENELNDMIVTMKQYLNKSGVGRLMNDTEFDTFLELIKESISNDASYKKLRNQLGKKMYI